MAADKTTRLHGHAATIHAAKAFYVECLGGRCVCCDEKTVEFLEVCPEAGSKKHGSGFYMPGTFYAYVDVYATAQPAPGAPRFRVLCANCRHAEERHGTCPHEIRRRREAALDASPKFDVTTDYARRMRPGTPPDSSKS
jgi:hypothetical protein